MEKSALSEIYEHYTMSDEDRDTQKANEAFEAIFRKFHFLSNDFSDEIFTLILEYRQEAEEKGFKDGFKYALQLSKECGL